MSKRNIWTEAGGDIKLIRNILSLYRSCKRLPSFIPPGCSVSSLIFEISKGEEYLANYLLNKGNWTSLFLAEDSSSYSYKVE